MELGKWEKLLPTVTFALALRALAARQEGPGFSVPPQVRAPPERQDKQKRPALNLAQLRGKAKAMRPDINGTADFHWAEFAQRMRKSGG